ncbi:MAG: YihY/virulence factor BrkB family protein [Actinobacteria bacterium]|nr:YihY/virulence factor BrkB family protein [Actinomycetota bacterium]
MQAVTSAVAQAKLRLERARARYGGIDIVVRTFKRFSEDDGNSYAAALTYYVFFSIFPLILASVSILGFVTLGNDDLKARIFDAGISAFPLLKDVLKPGGLSYFEDNAQSLAFISIALALYTGSGAIVALEHALNKLDHIGADEEGTFVEKRLRSLRWLAILGPAAIASAGLGGMATYSDEAFGEGTALSLVVAGLSYAGGFAISVILFVAAYRFLSKAERPWRAVLPGALAAALAFEVLKTLGALYLATGAATREATFGVFKASAALLIVAYLISRVTLLGAELNAVLVERRRTRQSATTT